MNPEQDKAGGLEGGLRNALDRGYSIEKAKQSFLNSGYKVQEIEKAAAKIAAGPRTQVVQPEETLSAKTPIKKFPEKPKTEKKISKKLIIILIIVSALIIAGASILGIFWDKIFGS